MAEVYRALDLETPGLVALKIMRHSCRRPGDRARFAREAEVQAALRHRNVAALLATGVTEQRRAVPRRRAAPRQDPARRDQGRGPRRAAPRRELRVAGAAGPRRGPRAGVLHRDLKPANIMLEPSPGPVDASC